MKLVADSVNISATQRNLTSRIRSVRNCCLSVIISKQKQQLQVVDSMNLDDFKPHKLIKTCYAKNKTSSILYIGNFIVTHTYVISIAYGIWYMAYGNLAVNLGKKGYILEETKLPMENRKANIA